MVSLLVKISFKQSTFYLLLTLPPSTSYSLYLALDESKNGLLGNHRRDERHWREFSPPKKHHERMFSGRADANLNPYSSSSSTTS